jgi:acyl-coenzyme A thioesterase PaaI-like protein
MNTKFFMDESCFACGPKNEHGLQLDITETTEGVEAIIKPPVWTQGYNKIIHGGIIATILDEMAVWAAYKKGYKSVTAELKMRIKEALQIDDEYRAIGKVTTVKHRLIQAKSEIIDKTHHIMAFADVKLIQVD